MRAQKIVITGGPCAGKSTAMSKIQNDLMKLGYNVFFVSESATELINSGFKPNMPDFQEHLMKYQLRKVMLRKWIFVRYI